MSRRTQRAIEIASLALGCALALLALASWRVEGSSRPAGDRTAAHLESPAPAAAALPRSLAGGAR